MTLEEYRILNLFESLKYLSYEQLLLSEENFHIDKCFSKGSRMMDTHQGQGSSLVLLSHAPGK